MFLLSWKDGEGIAQVKGGVIANCDNKELCAKKQSCSEGGHIHSVVPRPSSST